MKKENFILLFVLQALFLFFSTAAMADNRPAGTTAVCKDGSFFSGNTKRGACSHHGGIKEWFGDMNKGRMSNQPLPANVEAKNTYGTNGGSGQVWVNSDSKVYHCSGTRWYGKTKHGEYMSESQAVAQGNRADHNKACK
jgi:hypothetical protein